MLQPLPLHKGDAVALAAPASPVTCAALQTSIHSIEFLGLKPVVMPGCTMSQSYLSGPDVQRASDLNQAFSDPSIKGIFCVRGGYGSARILPLLDLETIRSHPKMFLGYSDITALHLVFNQLCGFVTFHSPLASEDYSRLDAYSLQSLKKALFFSEHSGEIKNPPGERLEVLLPGKASGILTGGNLTVLQSTLGSSYEVDTKGKILFLEDIGERPYRLDRALTSLALAGKFRDCTGIIFGAFTDCCDPQPGHASAPQRKDGENAAILKELFQEIIKPWGKPALFNLHAGHIASQCSLPLGVQVSFDAQTGPDSAKLYWG